MRSTFEHEYVTLIGILGPFSDNTAQVKYGLSFKVPKKGLAFIGKRPPSARTQAAGGAVDRP
jgi:hypothetical protein